MTAIRPHLKMFIMQNYDHSSNGGLQMIGAELVLHLIQSKSKHKLMQQGPSPEFEDVFHKLAEAAYPFNASQLQRAFGKFYCNSFFKIDEQEQYNFTPDPSALYDFEQVKAEIIDIASKQCKQHEAKASYQQRREDKMEIEYKQILTDEIQDVRHDKMQDDKSISHNQSITNYQHQDRPLLIKFLSRGTLIDTKEISREFVERKSYEEINLYNLLLNIPNMKEEMKAFCDIMSIPHPVYQRVSTHNKQYLKAFMAVKTVHTNGERIFLKATRGYSSYKEGQNQICRDLLKSLWTQNPRIIQEYFRQKQQP